MLKIKLALTTVFARKGKVQKVNMADLVDDDELECHQIPTTTKSVSNGGSGTGYVKARISFI